MIRVDNESPVACSCGEPAIRRTVEVITLHGGRRVSYDTHAGLHETNHSAALFRLDEFHQRLYNLQHDLQQLSPRIESDGMIGTLKGIELDTVHPLACEVRSVIVPTATLRAFGQEVEVTAGQVPLEDATVEGVMESLKTAALPLLAKLKQRRESGEY